MKPLNEFLVLKDRNGNIFSLSIIYFLRKLRVSVLEFEFSYYFFNLRIVLS